jgi:SnoaL-like domain
MALTDDDVQGWLDRYVEAWRTYDEDEIGALFSEDASYQYQPWDEPVRGREAIVASWLADTDPPGSWRASYRPYLISGNRAVITGTSEYVRGTFYWNIWSLTFDDHGRVSEFTEWFMQQPN